MKTIITFLLLIITTNLISQNYKSLEQIKEYLKNNYDKLETIEGIWSGSVKFSDQMKKLWGPEFHDEVDNTCDAVVLENGKLCTYYIDNEIKEIGYEDYRLFSKTSSNKLYLYKHTYNFPETKTETYFAKFTSDNVFYIEFTDNGEWDYTNTYVRIYPDENTILEAKKKTERRTGTGFALSSNGYIVTCNHVIENAKTIKIKGINGDFYKTFNVKVISSDVNNDIAILKIDDVSFKGLGVIPYTIKGTATDVGANVYVLGYPLTATMGDEIKLTNGIVSAKSGFKGDITSYQVTAAIQPGNSGGPLFDKNGNIIGIVNAKHSGAENASYAVKTSYLVNLIESLPTTPKMQTVNSLIGKDLTNKVKLMKKFVYIIEVN